MSASFPRGQKESSGNDKKSLKRSAVVESVPFGKKRSKVVETAKSSGNNKGASGVVVPSIGLGLVGDQKLQKVDLMSFGKLSSGCIVLGYVLQVEEKHLLVSLPGGFTGIVPYQEVSDVIHDSVATNANNSKSTTPALSSLVKPHQIVRCYILGQAEKANSKKKTITLSMRSSLVNKGLAMKHFIPGFPITGCIASKEDHGYTIATGVPSVNGFLLFKDIPTALREMTVGQPVDCVTTVVNEGARSISLRVSKKAFMSSVIHGSSLTFNALSAGMLVNAIVADKVKNGIILSFLGLFRGMVDTTAMPQGRADSLTSGDVVQARIIFIDHANKIVRLSMNKHILELRTPSDLPALGSIVEKVQVVSILKKSGVLLVPTAQLEATQDEEEADPAAGEKKQQKPDQTLIFVHKKSLADLKAGKDEEDEEDEDVNADTLLGSYRVKTEIEQVRVKGYNLVEGWIVASNEQKFLKQKVLHSTDLTAGQMVDVEISSIRDFGLVVKLAKGFTAICPTMHTSDIVVDGKVKKTLKVGQKHTMRVWELDGKAVVMTNKKSLLDLKPEALIKSVDDATVGKVTTGLISKINLKTGLTVRFFNKVKGVIPLNILAKQGVLELESSFRIGQIVKVVVIQKNEDANKNNGKNPLVLGLDLNVSPAAVIALLDDETSAEKSGDKSAATTNTATEGDGASALSFVSGTVNKLSEDSVGVVLDDGRPAKIHKHHLFDFAATADQMFASGEQNIFHVGYKIPRALILSEFKGVLNLTCKPLLLHAVENLQKSSSKSSKKGDKKTSDILAASGSDEGIFPSATSELVPGKTVVGFVSKVESYGVIVRFRENLSALAPRVNISDKFVKSPEGRFAVGDSIRCVVQRVDLVKERTLLTLKSSIVTTAATGKANFLSTSLYEAFVAARATKPSVASLASFLESNPLSSIVKAKVVSVQEYGVVLTAADNSTVIHIKSATTALSVGSTVKVVLIDVDYATCAVTALLHSDLQTHAKVKAFAKAGSVSAGATSAVVLAKRDTHLIIVTSAGVFGYCLVADYHNPKPEMSEFSEHSTIQVRLFQTASEDSSFPHSGVPLFTLSGENDSIRSVAALVQKDAEESDLRLQKRLSGKEEESGADSAALRQKFIESLRVGYLTKWIVGEITPYEVTLLPEHSEVLNMSIKAKIHVSNALSPFYPADELRKSLEAVSDHASNEIHDRHPFYGYKKGALIWCYVLQVRRQTASGADNSSDQDEFTVYCAKTFKTAESSEGHTGKRKASAGSSEYVPFSKMLQSHGKDAIKCPSVVAGAVTKITSMGCVLSFSPYMSAHINFLDISSDARLIALFTEKCYIGLKVVVLVSKLANQGKEMSITRADIESYLNETSSPSELLKDKDVLTEVQAKLKQPAEYKVGQLVTGILNLKNHHLPKPPAVMVGLKGAKFGRVCVTELSDVKHWQDLSNLFSSNHDEADEQLTLPDGRAHGSVVECRVLAVNDKYIDLSLRKSRVVDKKSQRATAPDTLPEEGAIVQGYVANVSKKGCFVRLSQSVTGQVMMKDISEEFVEDPEARFPVGKLVSARVLSINQVDSMARLSFKLSSSKESGSGNGSGMTAAAAGIEEGDTLTGVVQRITDFGVFVTLKDSGIVGLSRKAAALTNMNKSLEEEYSVGDTVRAKVLSVSANTQKIALGLCEHFFRNDENNEENEDSASEEMDMDEDEEGEGSDMDVDEADGSESEEEEAPAPAPSRKANKDFVFSKSVLTASRKNEESDQESEDDDEEEEEESEEDEAGFGAKNGGAELVWDDFDLSQNKNKNDSDNEESDNEEEQEKAGKDGKGLRTRQKEAAQRSAEQMTYQREAALLDGSAAPKTVEDFDRLLIAQPNSSYLWVRLIAFHLEKADVLSARNVATRALKTINFREENEKFNVWIAWLNLEHKYGTMESLTQVFDRAVNESKGKYIFLALADVYEKAGDYAGAEAIFQKALKRPQYKKSKKVWSAFHLMKLRSGDVKGAKEQFARSLQSLSKHKHVEVISKYALAEFEVGSPDRGRVVFEDLLNTYPKRTDLWHLYLDREVKMGNVQQARQLFERMIHSTLSARNMKTVFKKYLTFESQYGDEASQDAVKQKARDYVSNLA